jgi:predicted Zn-dependent protease
MTTLRKNQLSDLQAIDSHLEAKVLLAASSISFNFTKNVTQPVQEAFNKIAKNFWGKLITTDKKIAVQVDMLPIATDKRDGAQYLGIAESRAMAAVLDADKRSVGLKAVQIKEDQRVVINQNLLGKITKSNKRNMFFTVVHEVGHTLGIGHVDRSIMAPSSSRWTKSVNENVLQQMANKGWRKSAGSVAGTPTVSALIREHKL